MAAIRAERDGNLDIINHPAEGLVLVNLSCRASVKGSAGALTSLDQRQHEVQSFQTSIQLQSRLTLGLTRLITALDTKF